MEANENQSSPTWECGGNHTFTHCSNGEFKIMCLVLSMISVSYKMEQTSAHGIGTSLLVISPWGMKIYTYIKIWMFLFTLIIIFKL